ncbi:MAG TPA: hypothetical protein VIJ14_06080, partial [Rhabdochlamydiaceae bacterium]
PKPACPPKPVCPPKPKCAPKPKPKCAPKPKPACPPKPKCAPKPKPRCWNDKECNPTNWTLQARGAAFIPLKHQLREIYGSAIPTVELESSYTMVKWSDCSQLLLWENVGWSFTTGKSIGFGFPCKMNLVPFSVGVTYQYNILRNIDFYVGIGPSYSLLWIENKTPFETVHMRKGQFGFTTKTGFRFTFATNFFFDIFGDYYYTPFGKMTNSIQTIDNNWSGFFVGGGFGGKW